MWMYIVSVIVFLTCFFQFHTASSYNKIQEYKGNGYYSIAKPTHRVYYRVNFSFNSYYLHYNSIIALSELANLIRNEPKANIQIIGHTDKVGDEKYNRILSQQRANMVMDAFISLGVPEDNIEISSVGEESPVQNVDGPSKVNRRVDIIVETLAEP